MAGINKAAVKAQMRELKKAREAALAEGDHSRLHSTRRQLHALNRQIREHLS